MNIQDGLDTLREDVIRRGNEREQHGFRHKFNYIVPYLTMGIVIALLLKYSITLSPLQRTILFGANRLLILIFIVDLIVDSSFYISKKTFFEARKKDIFLVTFILASNFLSAFISFLLEVDKMGVILFLQTLALKIESSSLVPLLNSIGLTELTTKILNSINSMSMEEKLGGITGAILVQRTVAPLFDATGTLNKMKRLSKHSAIFEEIRKLRRPRAL